MVNTEDFTRRLHQIMDYHELSAASFADKIDVGRSSISHLLSGRNKPSLDFVMKIIQAFPEVELYWLLNGKGKYPASPSKSPSPSAPSSQPETRSKEDLFSSFTEENLGDKRNKVQEGSKKAISKIVFFYSDGSFEAFEN